jgi:hypothetical protein
VAQEPTHHRIGPDAFNVFGRFLAKPQDQWQQQQQQHRQQHTAPEVPAKVAGGNAAADTGGGGDGGDKEEEAASESTSGSSNSSCNDSNGGNGSQPDNPFNSIKHVNGFAKLAAKTVRNIHKRQRQTPPQTAALEVAAGFTKFACQVSRASIPSPTRGLLPTQQQHGAMQKAGAAAPIAKATHIHHHRHQQQQQRCDDSEAGREADEGCDLQMQFACRGAATAMRQPCRAPWLLDSRDHSFGDAHEHLTEAAAVNGSADLALPQLPSVSLSPVSSDMALDNSKVSPCVRTGMLQQTNMCHAEESCGTFEAFRCRATAVPRASGERGEAVGLLQSSGTTAEGVVNVFGMMNHQQLQHRRPGLAKLSSRGTCR